MFSGETKKLILVLTLLTACLFTTARAKGFGVDPFIVETTANSKKVKVGTFTVSNREDYPVTVELAYENWLKRRGFNNELSNIAPEEWIKVNPSQFEIKAQSSTKVNYLISIPEGLEGELVSMIFFVPKSEIRTSQIQSRFGVCVYAAIEKTEKLKCKIIETKIRRDAENDNVNFVIKVKNTGNVHVRPEGAIVITQEENVVRKIKLHGGRPIFPGQTIVYSQDWNNTSLPLGTYTAQAVVKYGEIYGEERSLEGKKAEFFGVK
ncbi:hypothetical protein ACFLUV_01540 [Elusimicrobiota bacterium]